MACDLHPEETRMTALDAGPNHSELCIVTVLRLSTTAIDKQANADIYYVNKML